MDGLDNFLTAPDMAVEGGLGDLEGLLEEALLGVEGCEAATVDKAAAGKARASGAGGVPGSPGAAAAAAVVPPFYEAAQCLTAVSPRGVLSLDANNVAHGATTAITGSGATAPPPAMTDLTEYAESQGAAPTTDTGGHQGALPNAGRLKREKERNRLAQARLRKRKREKVEHENMLKELQANKIKVLQETNATLTMDLDLHKRRVKLLETTLARQTTGTTVDSKIGPAGQPAQSAEEVPTGMLSEAGGAAPGDSLGQKMTSTLKILCTALFLVSEFAPASEEKNQSMQFLGNLRHSMKQALQESMPTARGGTAGAGPGSGMRDHSGQEAPAAAPAGMPTPPAYWAAIPPGMAAHTTSAIPNGAWPGGARPPPGAHVPLQAYPGGAPPGWAPTQHASFAPSKEPNWFSNLHPST